MASQIGKKSATVIRRLIDQPYRFTFFQAVRLLTATGAARRLGASEGKIGTTSNAEDEPVRFVSTAALEFPSTEIVDLTCPQGANENAESKPNAESGQVGETKKESEPVTLSVAFWGLIGPVGALPTHYTQLVIDRLRQRDDALHKFFGLFSHRQLSLFYRAWEKYFVPAGFERGQREKPSADMLRETLLALVGRGTDRVRDRLDVLDDVCVYYGGLFIDRPNAESLGLMTSDYLRLPANVISLFGSWLVLPASEQSRMGFAHAQLGVDTVLGERIWDPNSKFRLRVGPVGYRDFQRLMPTGDRLRPACQLVRSYVGCEYRFDVQLVLRASEIPSCRLGRQDDDDVNANLGWNTWLCSQTPTRDSDDAVFEHSGSPGDSNLPGP